jgi:hypothetical protein
MSGSFIRVVLHSKGQDSIATFVELSADMPQEMLDTNVTVSLGNEVAGSAAVTVPLDLLTMMMRRVIEQHVERQNKKIILPPGGLVIPN